MCARSPCVDNALGDAFMIEMEDFFAQHEILEQGWPACAAFQAVLVVANGDAVIGGQQRRIGASLLVRFATVTRIVDLHRHVNFPNSDNGSSVKTALFPSAFNQRGQRNLHDGRRF